MSYLYISNKDKKKIEAIQWTGDNTEEVLAFCEGKASLYRPLLYNISNSASSIKIKNSDTARPIIVSRYNYIIKGVDGIFRILKSADFEWKHTLAKEKDNNGEV